MGVACGLDRAVIALHPQQGLLRVPGYKRYCARVCVCVAEAWWALGLVAAVHALRVGAWALGDEHVRLLALEALACAEMLSVGPVLSPARARAAGAQGVATYVAIVLLIRLYRSRYWIWHETGNPASSLASMPPDQQWVEFALVKTWAQFTGGWIGYRGRGEHSEPKEDIGIRRYSSVVLETGTSTLNQKETDWHKTLLI
ncbi:Protein of unknown function [Gryllus bimaculatus]|nr:Protein of unknown function [Gryllus bimaculatus]